MPEASLLRYVGPGGSFELFWDESERCRLLRSPNPYTNTPWESKEFAEMLQFEDPAEFLAWFIRDREWFELKVQQIHPLMAGIMAHFTNNIKRDLLLNPHQHRLLYNWEGAMYRVDNALTFKQYCGFCRQEVSPSPRYPNYLCEACTKRITDPDGRRVDYFNTDPMGYGCQGYYAGTNGQERYDTNSCYIEGVACEAEEARFGGIVIQRIVE